jgi:hypothetical protein
LLQVSSRLKCAFAPKPSVRPHGVDPSAVPNNPKGNLPFRCSSQNLGALTPDAAERPRILPSDLDQVFDSLRLGRSGLAETTSLLDQTVPALCLLAESV